MTKREAEAECDRLQASHADRATHTFRPRQRDDGEWEVVKLNVPPPLGPGEGTVEAKPKPPTPSDPTADAPGYTPHRGGY